MSSDCNISLAKHLVDLFYPLVESTLFDAEGSIQEISNSFSNLKEDQGCDVKNCQTNHPYQELLVGGRSVRCLIYPLLKGKEVVGYLRLRYDLTHFKNLQEQLNLLVHPKIAGLNPEDADPWKESIDQVIAHYHAENKINIQATTAKQKRELISKLQSKGLLDFKESSAYIASKLQVARATIYNYLKTAANFRKVHIHQVDTFTGEKFGGNPAGVVLDADGLEESDMRKIARELNLSETSFVLASTKGDFQMRYFTPTGHEITFCGHSTVGALYMIAKERRFGVKMSGHYEFDVETPCGILKMEVAIDDEEGIKVAYETPVINLRRGEISHEEVAKAADFELDFIDESFPVMYEKN